ncbi:MAG: hypothetical protein K6U11_04525 [bacterium]|nr:hypothetical protein [bacterium]
MPLQAGLPGQWAVSRNRACGRVCWIEEIAQAANIGNRSCGTAVCRIIR